MKIQLHDSFNETLISSHRSIRAAVKARIANAKRVEKANGKGSYITYRISADNCLLTQDQLDESFGQEHSLM